MSSAVSILILTVGGLAGGSFITALTWRLHELAKSKNQKAKRSPKLSILNGRSMCDHCHRQLVWYDLVPLLSWLALHGRCHYCRQPISVQYPLIEFTTASLFVLSYLHWDFSAPFAGLNFGFWLVYLVLLVALLVYDLRWLILPNSLTYWLIGLGITQKCILAVELHSWSPVGSAGLGLAVLGGGFAILFYGSRGKWLGGGDVKQVAFIGLLLGWQSGLVAILIATYLGVLVFGGLIVTHRYRRHQQLPFGPLLITGTILAMFWGPQLVDWYLQLTGLH